MAADVVHLSCLCYSLPPVCATFCKHHALRKLQNGDSKATKALKATKNIEKPSPLGSSFTGSRSRKLGSGETRNSCSISGRRGRSGIRGREAVAGNSTK